MVSLSECTASEQVYNSRFSVFFVPIYTRAGRQNYSIGFNLGQYVQQDTALTMTSQVKLGCSRVRKSCSTSNLPHSEGISTKRAINAWLVSYIIITIASNQAKRI